MEIERLFTVWKLIFVVKKFSRLGRQSHCYLCFDLEDQYAQLDKLSKDFGNPNFKTGDRPKSWYVSVKTDCQQCNYGTR